MNGQTLSVGGGRGKFSAKKCGGRSVGSGKGVNINILNRSNPRWSKKQPKFKSNGR